MLLNQFSPYPLHSFYFVVTQITTPVHCSSMLLTCNVCYYLSTYVRTYSVHTLIVGMKVPLVATSDYFIIHSLYICTLFLHLFVSNHITSTIVTYRPILSPNCGNSITCTSPCTISGLDPGTEYQFTVIPNNNCGSPTGCTGNMAAARTPCECNHCDSVCVLSIYSIDVHICCSY